MASTAHKSEPSPVDLEKINTDDGSISSKEASKVVTSRDDGILMTPAAERAIVWKFDLRILPVLAVMYLFNSLDKSNLGNAKTAGLEKTLGLKSTQYNTILSIFFIPYVLTAPFLGILGKKLGPNRVLPAIMFSFGCFTVLVTSVMNFSGLLAIRWFLGMSESAFFPLVIYYLTTYALPLYIFPKYLAHKTLVSTAVVNWPVALPSSTPRKASRPPSQASSHSASSK